MDAVTILKKPFIIPSLLAGLIVSFRIAMLFVQYVQKKIRHHRQEEARAKSRAAKAGLGGPPGPPDGT